ncbi:RNA-binding protein [Candidatus Berkelbacteria bacterium]|nr:RNA-binding protein [Candidatus Berkelbacteria bacterium]
MTKDETVEVVEETTDETPAEETPAADVAEEAPVATKPAASNGEAAEGTKLFVGGISWGTTDEGLRQAFEAFGTVTSADVIREKMTGRSKGFGFVVMGSAAEAQAAIDKMNGQSLDGRQITVNVARPKTENNDRPRRDFNRY